MVYTKTVLVLLVNKPVLGNFHFKLLSKRLMLIVNSNNTTILSDYRTRYIKKNVTIYH